MTHQPSCTTTASCEINHNNIIRKQLFGGTMYPLFYASSASAGGVEEQGRLEAGEVISSQKNLVIF